MGESDLFEGRVAAAKGLEIIKLITLSFSRGEYSRLFVT